VALENSNEEDETTFTYADGWTLTELVGNIKKELKKYIEETEENINDEITYLEQEIQNKQKEINILNKKMDKLQELKNK
jgi:gas vesicle protein